MKIEKYKGCTCGEDRGVCVDCMQDYIDNMSAEIDKDKIKVSNPEIAKELKKKLKRVAISFKKKDSKSNIWLK